MGKYWFTLFCTVFILVYGLFCWHLIRWNDPSNHGTYKMKDEKEVVFHLQDKVKDEWHLEQCGHLKGVYVPSSVPARATKRTLVPCERPVITVPVPSTLWLVILSIIPLILIRNRYEK